MERNRSITLIILCLIFCLIFSACGQANSAPASSAEPTPEPTPSFTPSPTPVPTPTPKVVNYEALATQLNSDVESPPDETNASADAENSAVSGGIFEAGEECVIYRFWSAGINRELFDLLGNDGTEQAVGVYSELLNSFIASYNAIQNAVYLYEPDAKLVLHVVESSEATSPVIVVENGEVTYDYATEQGYFAQTESPQAETGAVTETPSEASAD